MSSARIPSGAATWFARRTHHWDHWSLADLIAAKAGRRVSLR